MRTGESIVGPSAVVEARHSWTIAEIHCPCMCYLRRRPANASATSRVVPRPRASEAVEAADDLHYQTVAVVHHRAPVVVGASRPRTLSPCCNTLDVAVDHMGILREPVVHQANPVVVALASAPSMKPEVVALAHEQEQRSDPASHTVVVENHLLGHQTLVVARSPAGLKTGPRTVLVEQCVPCIEL